MLCPHCGFTNKPDAARCECCLGDLAGVSEASPVETQPAAEAAPGSEPGSPPPPPEAPSPASPSDTELQPDDPAPATSAEPSRVPALSSHVPKAAIPIIIGLVVLGALGGLWLMKSRLGSSQPLSGRSGSLSTPEAVQPGELASPTAQTEVAPTDPATDTPSETAGGPPPSPTLSTETVPVISPEDEAAEVRYQMAVNFLNKGQNAQARRTLQEIIRNYPQSRIAPSARDLLERVPQRRPTPARGPAVVARSTRSGAVSSSSRQRQAREPVADRYSSEGKSSVVTTDDLLESRSASRTTRRRKQASIPPSLQAARTPAVQGARSASRDDVRLISVTRQPGKVVLLVQYHLATQHQRPVLVGAWVLSGGSAQNFGYNASPIAPGRGTATVTLSGVPPDLSRLRVAFLEQGGQRFFTKDLTVP